MKCLRPLDDDDLPNALGKVIGHEAVGLVEHVGDQVTDFAPGDRVVLPAGPADWRHAGPSAERASSTRARAPISLTIRPMAGGSPNW
ncbi:alcohol dehydrogenase catalytic domain-containing protein [Streptomyces sp. NPDC051636]|uniref:alcohol dehydrogenase catalytic domain-containing protein n=1 Tax=Streptomyces sp. NPDC051636 TaxID=3365663 RepID=UPI0037AFEC43